MKKQTILVILLSVLLAAALVWGVAETRKCRLAEREMHNAYSRAYASAAGTMEEVSLNLEKLALCREGRQGAGLLVRISRGAECVLKELTVLPCSGNEISSVLFFANRLSEYTEVLIQKTAAGEEVTPEEWEQLERLSAQGQRLTELLQGIRTEDMVKAAQSRGTEQETDLYADFVQQEEAEVHLLYDGAFSDAAKTEPKNLGLGEVTREEAEAMARAFVGEDRVISLKAEGNLEGEIPCYCMSIETETCTYHLQVTKTGKVYLMTAEGATGESRLSAEECREKAAQFLKDKGFAEMQPAYSQESYGTVTINFVAMQGDIWLYPDQIKVKVSTGTGEIIGFEGNNYLRNHEERSLPENILSEEKIRESSSAFDAVERIALCVIPHNSREIYCYEIRGVKNGENYLLYRNAESGEAEEILKVVQQDGGEATL